MLSSGFRIIWFKLHIQDGKKVRLTIPVSLNVLRELQDSLHDFMTVVCVFVPKNLSSGSRPSVHKVKDLIRMIIGITGTITDDGPYDLVDIAADKVKVSIKIR